MLDVFLLDLLLGVALNPLVLSFTSSNPHFPTVGLSFKWLIIWKQVKGLGDWDAVKGPFAKWTF